MALFMAGPTDQLRAAIPPSAWARYRRLMRFMVVVTLGVIAFAFTLLFREYGLVSIHLYLATALGIGASMLLMSVLMGLVFLSSGSGHDETVRDLDDPSA